MHKAHSTRQNIEWQLDLLVFIDVADFNRSHFNQVHNPPIEPGIAHLNVKSGLVIIYRLLIVNIIDEIAQIEA